MSTQRFFAVLLSFTSAATLSAQAPTAFHTAQTAELDLSNTVRLLEQNALFALMGAVTLLGMVWVGGIFKSCAQLNRPHQHRGKQIMSLLVLVAGLSVFGSSCSVEQWAMAEQIQEAQAAQAAEQRACPMHRHSDNRPQSDVYTYNNHTGWHGVSFCKYCGKRIHH